MMRVLVSVLLLVGAFAAHAAELHGKFEQGGLVLGRAAAGARILLDGAPVPADSAGNFVLGFGRDAPETAILSIDGQAQTLTVAKRDWPEQHISGLPPAKVTPDKAALERIAAEAEQIKQARARITPQAWFLDGWTSPADGPISGVFGSRRILNGEPRAPHSGTDVAAPTGAPVRSVGDGVVGLIHPDMYFTGLTVMIDHGLGLQSVYAHLSRSDVTIGQKVTAGQVIGAVGASGRATGPHLHWGASWGEVRLDPQTALQVLSQTARKSEMR